MSKIITEHFEDGKYLVKTTEDVQPLMDSISEQRNHGDQNGYKRNKARYRKIGELPMIILDQWMRETPPFNALDPRNEKELRRRLETDYKAFLTVDKV